MTLLERRNLLIDELMFDLVVSEQRRTDAAARLATWESDLTICAEYLMDALEERDSYRAMALAAIDRLAALTAERDKLQRRVTQLLHTARELRQAA